MPVKIPANRFPTLQWRWRPQRRPPEFRRGQIGHQSLGDAMGQRFINTINKKDRPDRIGGGKKSQGAIDQGIGEKTGDNHLFPAQPVGQDPHGGGEKGKG